MSEPMKKLHTNDSIEIIIHDLFPKHFAIPKRFSGQLFDFIQKLQKIDDDDLVPADVVFKDLDKKYGKIGAIIRGLRSRDNLTQVDLAKKLQIHQTHVSQIENKKRVVGKKLAQKLAKVFKTDYHLFL